MIRQLKQERSTWSLVTSIYRDRLDHEMKGDDGEEPMMLDDLVSCGGEQPI